MHPFLRGRFAYLGKVPTIIAPSTNLVAAFVILAFVISDKDTHNAK
jgi:hypothetical protein